MSTLNANKVLQGTLPPGHMVTLTALSEEAAGAVSRLDAGGDLIKRSHLVADPVPYAFGPFTLAVDVRIDCTAGSYAVLFQNELDEEFPTFVESDA